MTIFSQTDLEHGIFSETGVEEFVYKPLTGLCTLMQAEVHRICAYLQNPTCLSPKLSSPVCISSHTFTNIKHCMWNSWTATEDLDYILIVVQDTQQTKDMQSHEINLNNSDICFNWVLCISALLLHQFIIVFYLSSLACSNSHIYSS